MRNRYTREYLADNLRALGIERGDVVLVRASLLKVGRVQSPLGGTIVNALLDAVGEEGTIMGLSFTKTFLILRINKDYIFDKDTPAVTGGLVRTMLEHPEAHRSKHPSNSCVAIGKHSYELLKDHDENSTCFLPIENLIKLNGKMILIGCVSESPGFTTVHLAQEKLGLSSKSILKGFTGVYYRQGKDIKLFKRRDFGGCSSGFYKFYSDYVKKEKLKFGMIGNAYSVLINAKDAYEIELELIRKNNKYPLCNDPKCLTCRGTWWYNKWGMLNFYVKYLPQAIKTLIGKAR